MTSGAWRIAFSERLGKAVGVEAELALIDDRLFMTMHELDGVFDRDDMTRRVGVAMVDHRRERRRFTGAGRADDEDETALGHRDVLQDLGQLRSSIVSMSVTMRRMTMPTEPRWRKTLTRKRLSRRYDSARFISLCSLKLVPLALVHE
jgi:hypothetical protein